MSETKPGADIVADAREWLARYAGRETTHSDGCHRWHDACLIARLVAERDRLREAIRRIADQDATLSLQGGNVTVTMDATLTDEERKAIAACESDYSDNDMDAGCWQIAATLRGLLSRTGSIGAKAGDETTETSANSANVPERERFGSAANSQPIRRNGCGECLTDKELKALAYSIGILSDAGWSTVTLRKMLARLSPPAT
jgi:hypothetical protein